METLDFLGKFVERFGLGLLLILWFMFRHEKQMNRLTNKVNKLLIANVLISRTLDLDDEQTSLINAVTDEDSNPGG